METTQTTRHVPDPALTRIYFYLTQDCNLRCSHCWISPGFQVGASGRTLGLDLFRSIVEQGLPLGLKTATLTGGEPLLHPKFTRILHCLRHAGVSIVLETNAVLCTSEIAEALSDCARRAISVSLDGSVPETHDRIRGVPGSFKAALTGIAHLTGAGIKPQIVMTVMRENRDQVESTVRLAEEVGAGSVKFNAVQPIARGRTMHERGGTLSIEELLYLNRYVETNLSTDSPLALFFDVPIAFRSLPSLCGDNAPNACAVCGISNALGVLADGSYALCGIGETDRELVFGHAERDRLGVVWTDTRVLKELREGLPDRLQGVCGDCLMKAICRGGCIAQNYHSGRSLWASHWFCEAARAQGLFPLSRLAPP
ncbi:SynChlorMet cassette radical SAM/SPASM protein ScmF [Verrucomicrobiota bacterium]